MYGQNKFCPFATGGQNKFYPYKLPLIINMTVNYFYIRDLSH